MADRDDDHGSSTTERRLPAWALLGLLPILGLVLVVATPWQPQWALPALAEEILHLVDRSFGIRTCGGRSHANVGSNLRQITLGMVCYAAESDGAWPADFSILQTWSDGELVAKLFRDPRWPADPDAFTYVRPAKDASAGQPVVLTRPTSGRNPKVIACFADGHVATLSGTTTWHEAQRLAALAHSRPDGITAADWTTLPDLLKPPGPR